MSISNSDIEHVARLARLKLRDSQQSLLEFEQILALMTQLSQIDTSGVAPMAHPLEMINSEPSPWREDAAREVTIQAGVARNAPAFERDLFLVPRVID